MRRAPAWLLGCAIWLGCGDESPLEETQSESSTNERRGGSSCPTDGGKDAGNTPDGGLTGLTFRSDVTPVTQTADARMGVAIPPFRECREPKDGRPGKGPDGKVCTNVAVAGATEEGRYFPDQASCEVVLRQGRPFWSVPPAGETPPNDPRLRDDAYMRELAWVTSQVEASACVCCHDSKYLGKQAGRWDIRLGPIWLDSLSNAGLALFTGLADSSVLGAFPADQNNGFDRSVTGIPTTDTPRMQRFLRAELARRGVTEEQARAVPPFGGPIYANQVEKPEVCGTQEGIAPDGRIVWKGGAARYVYVGTAESKNPGVPPNLDLPEGTLWRLDVLASAEALAPSVLYGTTPPGSFQYVPERATAPALERGKIYHLTVLRDIGIPLANCLFEFGAPIAPEPSTRDAGATTSDAGAGGSCTLAGGDAQGFGAACSSNADCSCAASYCALQPGQSKGYCTKTGCSTDESLCPSGWSCFDLSRFAPGQPAICTR